MDRFNPHIPPKSQIRRPASSVKEAGLLHDGDFQTLGFDSQRVLERITPLRRRFDQNFALNFTAK